MKAREFEASRLGFKKLLSRWLPQTPAPRTNPVNSIYLAGNGTSRGHVLIVDDDAVVRLVTSKVLRKRGYEVTTAADCSEALAAIADARPDIVLVDLNFPPEVAFGGGVDWDGLRLIFWLHGLRNAKGARFIVITSSDSESCRQRASAAGVAGFLQKPINHARLLEIMERKAPL